jgi:hypothetical protein
MKVRAKFVVGFKSNDVIYMNPVYTGSDENKEFFKFTPGGQIILHATQSSVVESFTQGKEYYVDFTPAS